MVLGSGKSHREAKVSEEVCRRGRASDYLYDDVGRFDGIDGNKSGEDVVEDLRCEEGKRSQIHCTFRPVCKRRSILKIGSLVLNRYPWLPGNHRTGQLDQFSGFLGRKGCDAGQNRRRDYQLVIWCIVWLGIKDDIFKSAAEGLCNALSHMNRPLRGDPDVELPVQLDGIDSLVSQHPVGERRNFEMGFVCLCLRSEVLVCVSGGPDEGIPVQCSVVVLRIRFDPVGNLEFLTEKLKILGVVSEHGQNRLSLEVDLF